MYEEISHAAGEAIRELLDVSGVLAGSTVVVGCSSSEIIGQKIGSHSNKEVAQAVLDGILPLLKQRKVHLAAQCCEHLNRALVVEKQWALQNGAEVVAAKPQPKAGGSFASCTYTAFEEPVLIEQIQADAGLDIGLTMIGMHLKAVAVPLRLTVTHIGEAMITAAYTRPKYIGGARACYE